MLLKILPLLIIYSILIYLRIKKGFKSILFVNFKKYQFQIQIIIYDSWFDWLIIFISLIQVPRLINIKWYILHCIVIILCTLKIKKNQL